MKTQVKITIPWEGEGTGTKVFEVFIQDMMAAIRCNTTNDADLEEIRKTLLFCAMEVEKIQGEKKYPSTFQDRMEA